MFPTLYSLNHGLRISASDRNEGYYRIKNLAKMLGIPLMAILVFPSSLPSNSLTPDMIPTSFQQQQQPIENLITRTNTVFYNVTAIHPLTTNIAESNNPTSENTTCPDLIDVDPGSTAYNSQNIECVQQLFDSCTPSDLLLVYGLGSNAVSIKGKNDSNNDNVCSVELTQEIEMGEGKHYSCLIPIDKIASWRSWRVSDGVTALDDVLSFCNDIR